VAATTAVQRGARVLAAPLLMHDAAPDHGVATVDVPLIVTVIVLSVILQSRCGNTSDSWMALVDEELSDEAPPTEICKLPGNEDVDERLLTRIDGAGTRGTSADPPLGCRAASLTGSASVLLRSAIETL
jgi:hypothetical protein